MQVDLSLQNREQNDLVRIDEKIPLCVFSFCFLPLSRSVGPRERASARDEPTRHALHSNGFTARRPFRVQFDRSIPQPGSPQLCDPPRASRYRCRGHPRHGLFRDAPVSISSIAFFFSCFLPARLGRSSDCFGRISRGLRGWFGRIASRSGPCAPFPRFPLYFQLPRRPTSPIRIHASHCLAHQQLDQVVQSRA